MTSSTAREGVGKRPSLLNPALRLILLASFSSSVSFYVLLSVVPLYAASLGASRTATGMTTTVLMASTVVAELAIPALVQRLGYRLLFGVGLVLLGAPALALTGSPSMSIVYLVAFVRGLGFGIVIVLGSALVGSLAAGERRAEALGMYGVVIGLSGIVSLPAGVWLVARIDYDGVFLIGGISSLIAVAAIKRIPVRIGQRRRGDGILSGLRMSALVRPAVVFGSTALVAGIVVTFLPLAIGNDKGNLAASALLAHAVMATVGRWCAGRYGDHRGSSKLLIPAVGAVVLGISAVALSRDAPAVIAGMVLFGAGFGVAQNASLAMMFERASPSGYDTVSAIWNLAFDAGIGLGAAGFGMLAAIMSYGTAFAITGAIVLIGLGVAIRDRAVEVPQMSDSSGEARRTSA